MRWNNPPYFITDNKAYLDFNHMASSLETTYWGKGRPVKLLEKATQNSTLLLLMKQEEDRCIQSGFLRIVSDHSCFAWVCDFFIEPESRGKGLGSWMLSSAMQHPSMKVKRKVLATRDAQEFYRKFGFNEEMQFMSLSGEYMEMDNPEP